MLLGALEAGGTKMVFGVGNEKGDILERSSCPTTTPSETMAHITAFFARHPIQALGIGSFGPVNLDKSSPEYGSITTTPKPHWTHFPLYRTLSEQLCVPIGFDTDVNASALGEAKWGAAQGLSSCVYMTVGTGIGAGAVVEGRLLHGLLHPEMGHMMMRRHNDDSFQGGCPYHQDCLEGLASGPAIEKRWGKSAQALANDDRVWAIESYYLAQAVVNLITILSPQKIILGGGVMKQQQCFPMIRQYVKDILNGYIQKKEITERIDDYIVQPGLGDNAGFCGALLLAMQAMDIPPQTHN